MKRAHAWATVAAMAGLTALAVVAPLAVVASVVLLSALALPTGRRGYAGFVAVSVLIGAAVLAVFAPGPNAWSAGPIDVGAEGARRGAVGALRMAAAVGANGAALARARPAVLLDGLGLPRGPTAFTAAVLLAGQDLAEDAGRVLRGRRARGGLPEGRLARAAATARLLPVLLVRAQERGTRRAEALAMAGVRVRADFAPLVGMTAAAILGRIPFIAAPNLALTYVVVFLAGLLYGARVGVLVGMLSMLLSDLFITGLLPMAFVNVPAMGLLGLAGALARRVDFTGTGLDGVAGRLLAGAVGFGATLLFSVAADTGTWLLVPEFRGDTAVWRALVAAGLAFNAVPALVQAVLFAAAVGPVQAAFRARVAAGTAARATP